MDATFLSLKPRTISKKTEVAWKEMRVTITAMTRELKATLSNSQENQGEGDVEYNNGLTMSPMTDLRILDSEIGWR